MNPDLITPARSPGYPLGEFDAHKWAIEFDRIFLHDRRADIDVDLMLGWFANAMMTGYDRAKREDGLAPARGITRGLVLGALCWAAIFATAAVVWLNVIAPKVLP